MTRQEILPRSGADANTAPPHLDLAAKLPSRNWQDMAEKRARVGDSSPIGDDDVDNVVVEALGGGKIKGGG